eukprot:6176343-Pleurochrysis_carterae.AAC.1
MCRSTVLYTARRFVGCGGGSTTSVPRDVGVFSALMLRREEKLKKLSMPPIACSPKGSVKKRNAKVLFSQIPTGMQGSNNLNTLSSDLRNSHSCYEQMWFLWFEVGLHAADASLRRLTRRFCELCTDS